MRIQAEQGLSDAQMAEALEMTRQAVWLWRTGQAEPSVAQIELIVQKHAPGSWPFEMASAFVEAQYAAIREHIREAAA